MWAFIWRMLYAAICVAIFFWLVPLFLNVIGLNAGNALWTFIRACVACLAILYVLFWPAARTPILFQ